MASDATVVGAIIGSVLAAVLLVFILVLCYSMACLSVSIDEKSYKLYQLSPTRAAGQLGICLRSRQTDLEAQLHEFAAKPADSGASNIAVKSLIPTTDSVVDQGDILIARHKPAVEDTSDYQDAHQVFECSSQNWIKDKLSQNSTMTGAPASRSKQEWADDYDTISRTLMLQQLIEKSINSESYVTKVADPYSDNFISIGGIVVVVKPFKGTQETHFRYLQPGDLLRFVRVFVDEEYQAPLPEKIDKWHPKYGELVCGGIILDTYLEYNHENKGLVLKVRDSHDDQLRIQEGLFKDFPLSNVSLETTVLKSMIEEMS